MLLAAFAALACLGCAVGAPAATPISDAAALLEALAGLPGSGNTTLLLQQSVALSPADAAGYQLPFSIAPGETVRLQGGEPCPPTQCSHPASSATAAATSAHHKRAPKPCRQPSLQRVGPRCSAWSLEKFLCCWMSWEEGRWCWRT